VQRFDFKRSGKEVDGMGRSLNNKNRVG